MPAKALTALAQQRAAYADKNYPRLRAALESVLRAQVREVSERVAKKESELITADMRQRWKADLIRVQRSFIFAMAVHGWTLAGGEVAPQNHFKNAKSKVADLRALRSKSDPPARAGGVEVGDWENFIQKADWKRIDRWIATTAESGSATSATRLEALFKRASATWDETTQRGMTPQEMAAMILEQGITQCETRAKMLAHTGAIWAYNEGAVDRYADAGVTVVEWLTADDDLKCPFCADMNGKQVDTKEPFWRSGESFSLPDIGVLKIPGGARGFDVSHPPLHPNCRCTLIPVLE